MANAPRFRAYWQHVEDRSVLTMSRAHWDALQPKLDQPVDIDVESTPMAQVAVQSQVVRAVVTEVSTATAEVEIVRYEERDQPTPYNVDRYSVWTNVLSHPAVDEMISLRTAPAARLRPDASPGGPALFTPSPTCSFTFAIPGEAPREAPSARSRFALRRLRVTHIGSDWARGTLSPLRL